MLNLFKPFFNRKKLKNNKNTPTVTNWYGEDLSYPPTPKGFPVVPVDVLIEGQREVLNKARIQMGLGADFDTVLMPIIIRYARVVHLLPASEAHHHRRMSGLLSHGLEVGMLCAQFALAKVFPLDGPPKYKRAHEQRWLVAAFLSGLCHDLGKPISDMRVTSRDGQKIWDPLKEDLVAWLERENIDRYYVNWRNDRIHKNHERYTSLIWQKIVSSDDAAFLRQYDEYCLNAFLDAIAMQSKGVLARLTMQADKASVVQDLKKYKMSPEQMHFYGVPIERYIFDALRTLVQSNALNVNDVENGTAFHLKDGAYVLWNEIGELINEQLDSSEIPGIPRDVNVLASILIERGYAKENTVITDDGEVKQYMYWPLVKIIEKDGIKAKMEVLGLRFEDPKWVFTEVLPPITDKVINTNETKDGTSLNVEEVDKTPGVVAAEKPSHDIGLESPTDKASDATVLGEAKIPEKVKNSRVKQVINEARKTVAKRDNKGSISLTELKPYAASNLLITDSDKEANAENDKDSAKENDDFMVSSISDVMAELFASEKEPEPLEHLDGKQPDKNNDDVEGLDNSKSDGETEPKALTLSRGLTFDGDSLPDDVLNASKSDTEASSITLKSSTEKTSKKGSKNSTKKTTTKKKEKVSTNDSLAKTEKPALKVDDTPDEKQSTDKTESKEEHKGSVKQKSKSEVKKQPQSDNKSQKGLDELLKSYGNTSLVVISSWVDILAGNARLGHKLDVRNKKICITENAFDSLSAYNKWVGEAKKSGLIDAKAKDVSEDWDSRACALSYDLQILMAKKLNSIEQSDDPFQAPKDIKEDKKTKDIVIPKDQTEKKIKAKAVDKPSLKPSEKKQLVKEALLELAAQMRAKKGSYMIDLLDQDGEVSVVDSDTFSLIEQAYEGSITYKDLQRECFLNRSLGLKMANKRIYLIEGVKNGL